jgi:hypothetical protein
MCCLFVVDITTIFYFLVRVYRDGFNFAIWLGSHTGAHVFQGRCKHNQPITKICPILLKEASRTVISRITKVLVVSDDNAGQMELFDKIVRTA